METFVEKNGIRKFVLIGCLAVQLKKKKQAEEQRKSNVKKTQIEIMKVEVSIQLIAVKVTGDLKPIPADCRLHSGRATSQSEGTY